MLVNLMPPAVDVGGFVLRVPEIVVVPVEPARGVRLRGSLSNLKAYAHVGQADMGHGAATTALIERSS